MVSSNAVCCKQHAGSMRFNAQQKLLEICDGTSWLEVQLVPRYGSEKNPGTSCKDILVKNKLKKNNTPDGVHWIRFTGKGNM